ncbi:MAG TPA: iron chelate uptake ABC transporter family permease subunit, partial [Woeseiaceae bacterium]|nr:iron chelate uptake ABC transporter family permease subunit [Woeseiaceae bacterium]
MISRHLLAVLVTAAVVAILAACLLGSTPMGFVQVLKALLGQSTAGDNIVVWEIRLPRALAAFVVG